jgi:hypothetical protein
MLSLNNSSTSSRLFNINIYYKIPDTTSWSLFRNISPNDSNKTGWITYLHKPIINKSGYSIKPGISIFYENVDDSLDVIVYMSYYEFHGMKYQSDKIFNYENGPLTYQNAIGQYGSYQNQGVDHKIIIVYMIYKDVGIRIFCDSTTDVYEEVKNDFEYFIKSIYFVDN